MKSTLDVDCWCNLFVRHCFSMSLVPSQLSTSSARKHPSTVTTYNDVRQAIRQPEHQKRFEDRESIEKAQRVLPSTGTSVSTALCSLRAHRSNLSGVCPFSPFPLRRQRIGGAQLATLSKAYGVHKHLSTSTLNRKISHTYLTCLLVIMYYLVSAEYSLFAPRDNYIVDRYIQDRSTENQTGNRAAHWTNDNHPLNLRTWLLSY